MRVIQSKFTKKNPYFFSKRGGGGPGSTFEYHNKDLSLLIGHVTVVHIGLNFAVFLRQW